MTDPLSILIIEDSEDDRLLYRRALTENSVHAYHIVEAENGEQGLERLTEARPDCVLLDYSLPGRNGVEVLKRIRTRLPFLPVVMLTGQGNETVAVAAMREGAQDYIAKSTVTSEALERVVRVAIAHAAMQQRIHDQRAALEIFSHALAHDLKEPTHTIVCFTELLMKHETLSERGSGYAGHVLRAGERMQRLINAVFDYTLLNANEQKYVESCDMGVVLEEAKENLGQLIRSESPVITADVLPQLLAHRTQLLQLLQNLLSNAIHHGGKGVAIHVGAEEKPDHWKFFVCDNGPGIAPQYLSKIFDPFKRMASDPKRRGLGMGLAISQRIVELHGGKIWCESTPGISTTFFFTLAKPAAATDAAITSVSRAPAVSNVVSDRHNGLARMLLVDDNEADLALNRIMLIEQSRMQCEILTASNGETALNTLQKAVEQQNPIDLALLDINMPVMSGFELLAQLQLQNLMQHTTVVMCSTSAYDIDRKMALSMGAAGYLTKPPQFGELKAILKKSANLQLREESGKLALLRAA